MPGRPNSSLKSRESVDRGCYGQLTSISDDLSLEADDSRTSQVFDLATKRARIELSAQTCSDSEGDSLI